METIENAIKHLKVRNFTARQINMAIEALEKQLDKEVDTESINKGIGVSGEYTIESNMLCPNCKAVVGDAESDELFYEYCPGCGQKLKYTKS